MRVFGVVQVKRVRCEQSGVLVPKDKAIKRFIVRNIVDASAIRDIQEACVYSGRLLLWLVCLFCPNSYSIGCIMLFCWRQMYGKGSGFNAECDRDVIITCATC